MWNFSVEIIVGICEFFVKVFFFNIGVNDF